MWCLGVLGMVGIWLSIALSRDQACLWLAIVAALDIAFVLWLSGMQPGVKRATASIIGLILIVFASQWMIAAIMFGSAWGIDHFGAAQVIGKVLAWEFTRLRLTDIDHLLFGLSLLLALFLGFIGKRRKH
jgi:hypothetical protein